MQKRLLPSFGTIVGLLAAFSLVCSSAIASSDVINAQDFRGLDRASASVLSELVIRDLRLTDSESKELIVKRVNPFAPDAFLNVDGVVQGALVSERVFFRGPAHANGHSQVSLSIGADGSLRGVFVDSRGHWRLLSRDGRIEARLVSDEPAAVGSDHSPFQCGLNNDIRQASRERALADQAGQQRSPVPQGNGDRYRVRVAYDTTARFVDLFGTNQQATDYLGDLTNYISALYIAELNTEIVISSTTLRDADEPWNPDGDLLAQFENYWNDPNNNVDQNRTLAHIVDAGPSQGVAYVAALCGDGFDYGVSQGLGTEFDPNDNPQGWSFTVVAHELGHNFGSDHTHCYEPVIDECHNGEAGFGCWAGAESLPGPLGQQSGTIMSYCHLLDGGLSNIATTLGRGHGFGVQPERVPNTMRQHVLDRAQVNNPRCPQLVTAGPTTYTVTPSAGANGTIDPAIPVVVEQGNTAVFTVTPDNGFTATVGGTCGGTLVDNTFTTNPVNQNCTVAAQFIPENALCEQADLAIPDNNPAGIDSVLAVPAGGAIERLEVALEIDHSYVGDLNVELQHPSGTTVLLVEQSDCSGSDMDVVLDDQAALSIQDDCQNADPAFPGARYQPANALITFNDLAVGGNWTLNVSDNFADDTGVLQSWCLLPQVSDPGPTTFTVTPSAGANGTIDPAIPVVVEQGNTSVFTVTPDNGFTATVGGTCGGNLVDNTYTTNPVNQNCTVVAQFEAVGGGGLCQETDLPIPDNNPAGVTSILNAPAGGAIEKLEVQLEIDHSYVGDLIVELEHSDGTTVRLMNEQDCSGDNIDVILDDDAAPSIQDDCQDGGPAYPGERYRPDQPLAGFNGKPSGGNWTLRLSDNFADDTGVLRRWCLIPTEADGEVFADRFQLEQ